MSKLYSLYFESPIGLLFLEANEKALTHLHFVDKKSFQSTLENTVLLCASKQLDEYFMGKRKQFELELSLSGTAFQIQVWNELKNIPYGTVISYKTLANNIGNCKAVRAVGGANNKNPIPIIIPCHRVIGANGNLTGYSGDLEKKKWLLEHEKQNYLL